MNNSTFIWKDERIKKEYDESASSSEIAEETKNIENKQVSQSNEIIFE